MLINFYAGDQGGRQLDLFNAYREGSKHDVRLIKDNEPVPDGDADALIGVKAWPLLRALRPYGRPWLSFDKPYNRDWPKHWRVSVNAHHPTDYLMNMSFPGDRAKMLGWKFNGWRSPRPKGHILLAGSSNKAHLFFDLEPANDWAADIVKQIKPLSDRQIIYRPKPSFKDARPVPGARFSQGICKINGDLRHAHITVTYASVSCLDSLLAGVPCIILGPAIIRSISATNLSQIERPVFAEPKSCQKLLNNLAYVQWTLGEYKRGRPQEIFEPMLFRRG